MNNRWFLLLIDLKETKVVLLDSKLDPQRNASRKIYVRKLVTNETRMKIALDLVLNSHNKKDEVIKLAAVNWKNLDEKCKQLVAT
ncbi:hypothetical protein E2542_SST28416 [Spatholobus suberectus]|nr:hypothetical protein E2542_SST28416 [Spatholobus suberectus]